MIFGVLSGTSAAGVGGVAGAGIYITASGDYGFMTVRGAAAGLDMSLDAHYGIATSMSAFQGVGYNVCGGAGTVGGCVGGNAAGGLISAGPSVGVPMFNGSVSVTVTEPLSARQWLADKVCGR